MAKLVMDSESRHTSWKSQTFAYPRNRNTITIPIQHIKRRNNAMIARQSLTIETVAL